jgi:hypothetical protein
MPEIPPCPAAGPARLLWLDQLDFAVWNLARTDRLRLAADGVPDDTINGLLDGMPDYLAARIRGAYEAERLDWHLEKSA